MAYQYYNPYYQQPMPQQMQQQQQVQGPQIQTSGFIPVPSEEMARNYPVAPGNSVTFKNENAPYVYTKTMGFSQLDRPIFEKYKLVKEEDIVPVKIEEPQKNSAGDEFKAKIEELANKLNSDGEDIRAEIAKIWDEINDLKKPATKKKDGGN